MDSSGTKRTLACLRCSEKRIKCDRKSPCTTCTKHNTTCAYRARKARSKRDTIRKDQEFSSGDRLNAEGEIAQLEPAQVKCAVHSDTASNSNPWLKDNKPINPEPQTTFFKPLVIGSEGSTKLVNNSLWSRIAEEIHDEDEDGDEDNISEEASNQSLTTSFRAENDSTYILGQPSSAPRPVHPHPEQIRSLWKNYVENVEPMMKILHIPSLGAAIEQALINLTRIPRNLEALLFSIYSMAVLSISNEECQQLFGQSRTFLLAHYISATKLALVRARFMSSTSLIIMQALTLHLFSIRDFEEPRAVWNLTGLALRVAQGMGMFIDGKLLGLSPFETEMRRRLWWQLLSHDSRAADLCGQAKFQLFNLDETTPKAPLNVNDSELHPGMLEMPVPSTKPTEMLWCQLRVELQTFAAEHKKKMQQIRKTQVRPALTSEDWSAADDMAGKDAVVNEIEAMVESKYLRFCDASKPLHLLTLLGGRTATDFVRFVTHHPRRWAHQKEVPVQEKELVWKLCTDLLERVVLMQSMPQIKKFSWIVDYFIQWPIIIHIVDTLRLEPCRDGAAQAWEGIGSIYDLSSELLFRKDRPISVAIGRLCLRAHRARVTANAARGMEISTPDYISKLEKQNSQRKQDPEKNVFKPESAQPQIVPMQSASDLTLPDDFWFQSDTQGLWDDLGVDNNFDAMLVDGSDFLPLNDMPLDWDQWEAWLSSNKP